MAEAHAKLKAVLLGKGCKIVSEKPPASISVVQGSIWGVSPRSAKKTASFTISIDDSGTKIAASSRLTSDWKNLSIVGTVLAVGVTFLCLWIKFDLETFIAGAEPSFWSWLATSNSTLTLVLAELLAKLSFVLAFFLAVSIVLEVFVVFYANRRVNAFAEECLKLLS